MPDRRPLSPFTGIDFSELEFQNWKFSAALLPIPIVDVRENIVPRLHLTQPVFVHSRVRQLVMYSEKSMEMILHSFAGIIWTRAGAKDERPITGLRQQQFTGSLLESP